MLHSDSFVMDTLNSTESDDTVLSVECPLDQLQRKSSDLTIIAHGKASPMHKTKLTRSFSRSEITSFNLSSSFNSVSSVSSSLASLASSSSSSSSTGLGNTGNGSIVLNASTPQQRATSGQSVSEAVGYYCVSGSCSMQGRRREMEDRHYLLDKRDSLKATSAVTVKSADSISRPALPVSGSFLSSNNKAFDGQFVMPDSLQGVYLVADGHGSADCSQFITDRACKLVVEHPDFGENDKKMESLFRDVFVGLDEEWNTVAKELELDGGTTALMAAFVNKKLYVAWGAGMARQWRWCNRTT
jgi:hypothetical protein